MLQDGYRSPQSKVMGTQIRTVINLTSRVQPTFPYRLDSPRNKSVDEAGLEGMVLVFLENVTCDICVTWKERELDF